MPLPASRGLPKTSEYAQGFGKMPCYRLIWQAYLGSAASVLSPIPLTPFAKELLDGLPQPAVRRVAIEARVPGLHDKHRFQLERQLDLSQRQVDVAYSQQHVARQRQDKV